MVSGVGFEPTPSYEESDTQSTPNLTKRRGRLITIRPNTRPFGIFLPFTSFTPYAERQSHLFAAQQLNMLRVQELRKKNIIFFLGF